MDKRAKKILMDLSEVKVASLAIGDKLVYKGASNDAKKRVFKVHYVSSNFCTDGTYTYNVGVIDTLDKKEKVWVFSDVPADGNILFVYLSDFILKIKSFNEEGISEEIQLKDVFSEGTIDTIHPIGTAQPINSIEKARQVMAEKYKDNTIDPARYFAIHKDDFSNKLKNRKEKTMSVTFETKDYFNNYDVSQMTDSEVFEAISSVEEEMARLDKISTPSEKLDNRLAELQDIATKLSKIVDER